MRIYETMEEAILEIRRDVYKGTPQTSSRVQQRTNQELQGRERLFYTYAVMGGFPETPAELVALGIKYGFRLYKENPKEMEEWLDSEVDSRIRPLSYCSYEMNEQLHPALKTTIEGSWPSYTYRERMVGALSAMEKAINRNPDTRRAYWPIFTPQDGHRSMAPTRVPCSLGYQALVRRVGMENRLIFTYLSRSCDYDTFWLTDLWIARQLQVYLANRTGYIPGMLVHFVISFHSFEVEGNEIY